VVDGRSSFITELEKLLSRAKELCPRFRQSTSGQPHFLDALPGYLLPDDASQARIGHLMAQLRRLEAIR
jgi:hypothetical protein